MKMSYKTENNATNLAAKKEALALAQDLSLARNLAENDEKVRRKALKFLEKYISRKCKEKILSIDNLKIIWKGLFYSMWMSDKPLIQEECAENISKLIHCCSEVKEAMDFFKVGLMTIQNEWIGIDQHRMDKFCMLVRRLLRQAFAVLEKINFRKQPNEYFAQVIEETILSNEKDASLGLFMHFTEIYLEELAKISNGKIQSPRTTDLIKPFIKKIAFASDHRIIEWINKFIFTHLMKQHELGLDYADKYQIWKQHGFVGSINDIKKVPITENSDSSEDDDVIEEKVSEEKPLDPRAGRVDVELPQIRFNAKEISEALLELKTHSHTNKDTRKQLVNWSKMFLKLHEGYYPLGMTKFESKNKNDKFIDTKVSKAAKRLIKFEQQLLAGGNRKRKIKNNLVDPEVPINNKKIKVDTENATLKKKKGKKIQTADTSLNSSIDEYNYTFERNSGTWFVTKELHTESLSKTNGFNHFNGENISNIEILPSGTSKVQKMPNENNNKKVISNGKNKISRLSLNVNNNKSKIENSRRKSFSPKKVIFNTKLNVSQEMEDHIMQIISSPQIPWDNTKKPGKPLLKSPLKPSPINPFYKLKFF